MTVVILAGGKSTRMGRDKLELPLGGKTMLAAAAERYGALFDRVVLSLGGGAERSIPGTETVRDIYRDCGPLGGLHAALKTCGEDVFLTAADMPYSDPRAALLLAELCGDADACVLTDAQGRPEPLFGFYRARVLSAAEAVLDGGRRSMRALLGAVNVKYAAPEQLGTLWSEKLTANINEPSDYEKLCLELNGQR